MFGTSIHNGMDWYYRGIAEDGVRDEQRLLAGFLEAWEKEDERLQEVFGGMYGLGLGQQWWDYKLLGEGMLRNYHVYDKGQRIIEEVIDLAIEERSFVDILNLQSKKQTGKPLLSGRIDLVIRDKRDQVWIWDHKTAAKKPNNNALDLDDQITGYCYIYWRLSGVVPAGAVYNALLKRMPEEPKILKSGVPSTDKRQNLLKADYVRALQQCGVKDLNTAPTKPTKQNPSPTTYAEMLKSLDDRGWSDFFHRHWISRTEDELRSFHQRLFHESVDMRTVLDHPELAYTNANQQNCMGCPMLPLCRVMEERGDVEFVRETMYDVVEPRTTIPGNLRLKGATR
jgi:hypothetical protein